MTDFAMNADGLDLELSNNDLYLVEGNDFLAQRLTIGLSVFQGEYRYNQEAGVPWFQAFEKGVPLQVVDGLARRQILATEGVVTLNVLETTRDETTRRVTQNFLVNNEVQGSV